MCGITVWIDAAGVADPRVARSMTDRLRHRGPDDEGHVRGGPEPGNIREFAGQDTPDSVREHLAPVSLLDAAAPPARIHLGHRRLSILDLSPAGHQPMETGDRKNWIVHNGEVYNYLELRRELEAEGDMFRSGTDTEVILAAVRRWGREALARFVGMFALAIWDVEAGELLLARDPFGIKPLYYHASPEGFVASSEIPSLLEHPSVSRNIDGQAALDFLRHGLTDHGERTMFRDVKSLPPGHCLRVSVEKPESVEITPFLERGLPEPVDLSFEEARDHLRELFVKSVTLHLRSDVPVGAALSGGLDSSAIVAAMRHVGGERLDLQTFSYIASGKLSEEAWVDRMVEATGAHGVKIPAGELDLAGEIERLQAIQGEPFISTSILAQRRVFHRAREAGVPAMLDGQGADEMLAGYFPSQAARLAGCLSRGQIGEASRLFRALGAPGGAGRRRTLLRALASFLPALLEAPARGLAGEPLWPRWLDRAAFETRGARARSLYHPRSLRDLQEQLLQMREETSLPMLLRYEDRNSMADSIESRVPFLTVELVDFVASLPPAFLIDREGRSKAIFREALRGLVPDAVIDRPDKIGFATPELDLLLEGAGWVEERLESEVARSFPGVRADEFSATWREIRAGRRPHEASLWRWLNFTQWLEQLDVKW